MTDEWTWLTGSMLYDAGRRRYAMDPSIRSLAFGVRLVGRAFTVSCEPGDNLALHRALAEAPAGVVIVAGTRGGTDRSYCGALMCLAAQRRGIAGLILDGLVRDSDEIVAMGLPVFCRGAAHVGAVKRNPGILAARIDCGGVGIAPGQLVVGDSDGVVTVPLSEEAVALERARASTEREELIRAEVLAGRTLLDLIKPDEGNSPWTTTGDTH
jgi:4-hydroxy-4-methyl-2-oxoglutarate aldolase